MYAVYINCRLIHFLNLILSGAKVYETRTRDMLRRLVGQRVYLAETGTGPVPMVMASAVIASARSVPFSDVAARDAACIVGTPYDIKPDGSKVFYRLTDVQPVAPFPVPACRINHGRAYTEF